VLANTRKENLRLMGKYWQGPHDDRWYLSDEWSGETKLIHRWRDDYEQGTIHCPDCDIPLMFKNYKATCPKCGEEFKSGWGKVFRVRPFGTYEKKQALRPYVSKK
jgi:hypothetical protein